MMGRSRLFLKAQKINQQVFLKSNTPQVTKACGVLLRQMFLETLIVGDLQENCYLLACEATQEAALIDPGAEAERLLQAVTAQGFTLKYILNTHGHFDHIGAIAELVATTGAAFLLHEADLFLLDGLANEPLQAYFQIPQPPHPTHTLKDGDRTAVGKLVLQVLHTPGHTPGSVCFRVEDVVFSGDTLFFHSVGRTDLPGGSHERLLTSLREKLLSLNDAVRVLPGHGPATTIGNERQSNPFL